MMRGVERLKFHKFLSPYKTKDASYCKSLVAFFPRGYSGYARLLVTFKTKYETGLKESLEKLDRSSYLWKFNDTIILILFVDDYNGTCEQFNVLEEIGMIHDLRVSIPIRYYEPHINLGRGNQALHQNLMALLFQ